MTEELAPRWQAWWESALRERRHGARRRQAGVGPKYELVFADRLLATLIHLRTGLTHQALAVKTMTRAAAALLAPLVTVVRRRWRTYHLDHPGRSRSDTAQGAPG
ncbi:hypothetical protein ACFY20_46385 [Streptomyces sp. NPDC001312]|uniref:hypothetical protein n=1 Tax=Streptomyces sp. NPDC001312 TaxID=3364561 RepID=UPI0036B7BDA4